MIQQDIIIPILDLTPISTKHGRIPSKSDWLQVANQLEKYLIETGFLYLKNHEIAEEIINPAFQTSLEFFELSNEIKMKYLKDVSSSDGVKGFHGYAPPNKEILNPKVGIELRESFDIDRKITSQDKYPNQYIPNFQTHLNTLEFKCRGLIRKLHTCLAIALGMENVEYFNEISQCLNNPAISSYTAFRSNYYPPIVHRNEDVISTLESSSNSNMTAVRCGEHTDYGILTLLFQDQIGGLEIKPASAEHWIPVEPIPGTILMNTGDMLEFCSAGKFPATWHRVRIPESAYQRQIHRQSIVYFVFPDDETILQVFNNSSSSSAGTESKKLSAFDYATDRISRSYKY